MTFDIFEKTVNHVMNKKPLLFELERDKIASEDEIKQVENSLHCILPQNYKSFVKRYGGGYFGYNVVLSCDLQGKFYIGKYYDIYNQLPESVKLSKQQSAAPAPKRYSPRHCFC